MNRREAESGIFELSDLGNALTTNMKAFILLSVIDFISL